MTIRTPLVKLVLSLLIFFSLSLALNAQIISNPFGTEPEPLDSSMVPFQQDRLFGFVDRSGKVVIEPQYEKVSFFSEKGYAKINKLGLYGIIDKKGKEVIPPI